MNLKTFINEFAHKVDCEMFTDYSFQLHGRVDIVLRFRFATTIDELASLLDGGKLFGRLHRSNLTVKSPYGLVTENILTFDIGNGKYKEEFAKSKSATDAISFSISKENETASLNVFEDGKLIKTMHFEHY